MDTKDYKVCGVTAGSEPAGGGGLGATIREKLYLRLIELEERVYRLEHPEEFNRRGSQC